MSVRRVLLTTDAVGGVWTYTVELARALSALGVEPVVATLGPSPDENQSRELAGANLFDTGLPLDWLAENPEEIRDAGAALA
ncbi:MAG TPA: glycosyltransferase family 1 protein, partial [Sphingomicrobium sp.]